MQDPLECGEAKEIPLYRHSKAVAFEAEVFTEETMPKLLAKEKAQADSLKAVAPEVLPEEKKEAKP